MQKGHVARLNAETHIYRGDRVHDYMAGLLHGYHVWKKWGGFCRVCSTELVMVVITLDLLCDQVIKLCMLHS
jgi:hypothetical protein